MTAVHTLTETEFQTQVVGLARLLGWRTLHIRRTIGRGHKWTTSTSITGWPDLILMRPPDGLLFIELKTDTGKPTPEQSEILEYLDQYPFAQADVWRPSDWPEIQRILSRRPNA